MTAADTAWISVLLTSCTLIRKCVALTTSSPICAGSVTHDLNLLAPITTKPWGTGIPELKDEAEPSQEMRDSQLLYNEPKYIRMDEGDIHTLESNGLTMKSGVYY